MCRLLYVRADEGEVELAEHLVPFAEISRKSREYQGHGWGLARLAGEDWELHHDIRPVWEDDVTRFGRSRAFLAHARSAFENRDIRVENNMPFRDGDAVFAFNGELRGVRIRAEGRIGAEKVFRFIRRMDRGDTLAALRRGTRIIHERTTHVKAMNLILADPERAFFSTSFSESPDYFTLRRKRAGNVVAYCSEPYPGETDWEEIPSGTSGECT